MGETGRILSVAAKLKGTFFKDQTLTASGQVTGFEVAGEETYVDLDLSQVDESDRLIAVATAQVALKTNSSINNSLA